MIVALEYPNPPSLVTDGLRRTAVEIEHCHLRQWVLIAIPWTRSYGKRLDRSSIIDLA